MTQFRPRADGRRACLVRLGALGAASWLAPARAAAASAEDAATGYLLGVVPYFSPTRLEQIYAPAAAELGRLVGREVRFRTASSWDRFFEQMRAQRYDLMLVHGLYYVVAADEFGYLPLVRMREPFSSSLVVPEASALRSADDLRGRSVATPPAYLPATLLAKQALRERGLVRERDLRFDEVRTVDACLQAALTGIADACVAPTFAVDAYQASTGAKLRVLLRSADLPSPVFAVHRRVPVAERERLRAALLDWNRSAAGRAVLRSINTDSLVPASDADYAPVRQFVKKLDEPWRPSAP